MRLFVVAGAAYLLVGCATLGFGGKVSKDVDLVTAVNTVWALYGRTDKPPQIRVVEGDQLTCKDPVSTKPGFQVILENGFDCRGGLTILPVVCEVARVNKEPWYQTSLAHELKHSDQARRGIVDPNHKLPEWDIDVPKANAALAGLEQ